MEGREPPAAPDAAENDDVQTKVKRIWDSHQGYVVFWIYVLVFGVFFLLLTSNFAFPL